MLQHVLVRSLVFGTTSFLFASNVFGYGPEVPEFEFQKLWSMASASSVRIKAAEYEKRASRIGADRAARHWFPQLSLAGKSFTTNDPGTNFMLALEQRQLIASDFAVDNLNQPGSHGFQQGSLILDYPIFEGGLRSAQARALDMQAQSKDWDHKAQKIEEYVRLASDYSEVLALNSERRDLLQVQTEVLGVLERYSIGLKGNPVGYSGLLGLKTLKNRIEGALIQNEVSERGRLIDISILATGVPKVWKPKPEGSVAFLKSALSSGIEAFPETEEAASVRAARSTAESQTDVKRMERARFLPRIGAFAQGDLSHGKRSVGTSYSAGAYLQWDLFAPTRIGAVEEASIQALAAEAKAEALSLQLSGERDSSRQEMVAAEGSLKLLNENAELLAEQTQIARQLFRSGILNALQLAEVFNRRVDLIAARRETEKKWTRSLASLYLATGTHLKEKGMEKGIEK